MSGNKCSEVQLQQERQEKLNAIGRIQSLNAETEALSAQLTERLEKLSPGLRETFAAEVRAAQQWTDLHRNENLSDYTMENSISDIRQTVAVREEICRKGQTCLENLHLAQTRKADQLGQEISRKLAEINRKLLESAGVLQLWCGETALSHWHKSLTHAEELQSGEHYHKAGEMLQTTEEELNRKCPWAAEQEEKHQKRLYLLKALRQVSYDLGFTEKEKPVFEKKEYRGSRIVFTVNTHDRGEIRFYLSLNGLTSYSDVRDDLCPLEFDALSRHMEEKFGIQTRFRTQDGNAAPELMRKNEKDLPEDSGQAMESGRN